jgi:uncharacterized protein
MQVEGQFQVRAGPAQVFAFFSDPRKLLDCLEDPHTVDSVQGDQFAGTITTGVAFIRGTFRFSGQYTERTAGQRVTTKIRGSGLGSAVDATLSAMLTAADPGTALAWKADIVLTGPAATLGERLVRSTIEKKAAALFEKARQQLEAAPTG